jgi:hypothetical protein
MPGISIPFVAELLQYGGKDARVSAGNFRVQSAYQPVHQTLCNKGPIVCLVRKLADDAVGTFSS